MPFPRIEDALEECGNHIRDLEENGLRNQEVETFLVSGLIVLIVSEYEEYLEKVFIRRAEQCGDVHTINFIKSTLSTKFRSPDLSKINETLKRFDQSYRASFLGEVENSAEHAAWDSLMKARHAVVHKKNSLNLTFLELNEKYPLTKNLIQKVEETLGVV